jgi:hypothetical protein
MATRFAPRDKVEVQGFDPSVDGRKGTVIRTVRGDGQRYVQVDIPDFPPSVASEHWLFKPEELRRIQ